MRQIKIVPQYMWVPLLLTVSCNALAYDGTRLVTANMVHYNLSNRLDDQIPLIPWTVVIYFGCYVLWIVNYILGCRQERKTAFRFISADFLAKIICMICFVIFPTTNVRPIISGNTIWDVGMRLLYRMDAADNLFPSIHCLTSWFCYIAVRENDKIPLWYRRFSAFAAVLVFISTLTTKQHVLIDVVAGVALAEGCYYFVKKSKFALKYESWMPL